MDTPRESHRDRTLQEYGDQEVLERLRERGIESVDAALPIEGEQDINGRPIDADIAWLQIAQPEDEEYQGTPRVEGKLYFPRRNANGEVIIFTPGLPGGNAGRFERHYARTFVDAGYGFFTVRHNGSSLDGPRSEEIINAGRRQEVASQLGEKTIGGFREDGYTPADVIEESVAPFLALQKAFKKTHLMGQSMGTAASYNVIHRLRNHPELLERIGNVVGIAGFLGKTREDDPDGWDGMNIDDEAMLEHMYKYGKEVGMNLSQDPQRLREGILTVAAMNRDVQVPDSIGNVLVYTPNDPLVSGPNESLSRQEAMEQYGPASSRKLIIRNEGEEDTKPHSMLWIKPENLLRAVRAKVSSHGPHHVKIPRGPEHTMEPG